MRNARSWTFIVLSSLTLATIVFLVWELITRSFFKELDYKTLHYLYISRGITVTLIIALWAMWFIWRGRLRYQDYLAKIINNSTDAILVHDESGEVLSMNREAENKLCGSGKRELGNILDIFPPEYRMDFSKKLQSVKAGSRVRDHEVEVVLENGERIHASIGMVYVHEGSGKFIETIRDMSERMEIRNKIIELEKAQVVGKMAEGVAHHMGTPLASMLLRIQMLKEDIPQVPGCAGCMEKLDLVERQIFYSKNVIQKLLEFARRPQGDKHVESIAALINEGADIIRPILRKKKIELEVDTDGDIKVWANGNLLELVFSDIMMNAVDAMPEGGKISVSARETQGEDGGMLITISDTGTGIPISAFPFVFDPFFTTKPAGKGTGLGLSVAKSIIQDHEGEINIESEENKGTTVYIRLPIFSEG